MKRLTAKDVMNKDVLSVGMDWSIEYLTDFLVENGISGAPVTSEDGKLVGVVSLTDIVRHSSLPGNTSQLNSPYDYYRHGLEHHYATEDIRSLNIGTEALDTVRDIMTPMVFDVTEDMKVKQVAGFGSDLNFQVIVIGDSADSFVKRTKEILYNLGCEV